MFFQNQTLENASRRLDQLREIEKLMVPINIKNFNQQNLAKLKFSLFKDRDFDDLDIAIVSIFSIISLHPI